MLSSFGSKLKKSVWVWYVSSWTPESPVTFVVAKWTWFGRRGAPKPRSAPYALHVYVCKCVSEWVSEWVGLQRVSRFSKKYQNERSPGSDKRAKEMDFFKLLSRRWMDRTWWTRSLAGARSGRRSGLLHQWQFAGDPKKRADLNGPWMALNYDITSREQLLIPSTPNHYLHLNEAAL